MAASRKARLNSILRGWVSPYLKPLGFRQQKITFDKESKGATWLVDFQWGSFGKAEDARFTINCGIFVPQVFCAYYDCPEPACLQDYHCCIRDRIGHVAKLGHDKWWDLKGKRRY